MHTHPRPDHLGHPVPLHHPHTPTPLQSWAHPEELATAVPDGPLPEALNGIPLTPWEQAPQDRLGWLQLTSNLAFPEPAFDAKGRKPSAGAAVVEPDGRIWLVAPSNGFGGYQCTLPKGQTNGQDLRATALNEVFEETGLRVELYAHLVDVSRSTSRARYYLARRTGGSPAAMGWESQAVHLAPPAQLKRLLHHPNDLPILEALEKILRDPLHP